MLAVGVLLIALGVVFLAVPLEQLQKVFRRMRSRIGTKIGGAVLVAAGIALALYCQGQGRPPAYSAGGLPVSRGRRNSP